MIIGISGKKQHGKDTVAKIIQYLAFDKRHPGHSHNIDSFSQEHHEWRKSYSTWETKQFAHKLKLVVSVLIGCTLEQLEDNKFKEAPLGEEWRVWYWRYKNEGHKLGKIFLSKEEAVEKTFTTDKFEELCELISEILTPRKLLQLVGTEAGRDLIHPNIWVNALMTDYKWEPNPNGILRNMIYPNWIITDVRFPSEVKAIESRGGVVIRVHRPNPDRTCLNCLNWWFYTPEDDGRGPCPKCGLFKHAAVLHEEDTHSSETSLDKWRFEHMITNNGSISSLISQVESLLKHHIKHDKA